MECWNEYIMYTDLFHPVLCRRDFWIWADYFDCISRDRYMLELIEY